MNELTWVEHLSAPMGMFLALLTNIKLAWEKSFIVVVAWVVLPLVWSAENKQIVCHHTWKSKHVDD
jgi:hypothetical protein